MSSIGTGYDLSTSVFSPDGRIFQIDYGQKVSPTQSYEIFVVQQDENSWIGSS